MKEINFKSTKDVKVLAAKRYSLPDRPYDEKSNSPWTDHEFTITSKAFNEYQLSDEPASNPRFFRQNGTAFGKSLPKQNYFERKGSHQALTRLNKFTTAPASSSN